MSGMQPNPKAQTARKLPEKVRRCQSSLHEDSSNFCGLSSARLLGQANNAERSSAKESEYKSRDFRSAGTNYALALGNRHTREK